MKHILPNSYVTVRNIPAAMAKLRTTEQWRVRQIGANLYALQTKNGRKWELMAVGAPVDLQEICDFLNVEGFRVYV